MKYCILHTNRNGNKIRTWTRKAEVAEKLLERHLHNCQVASCYFGNPDEGGLLVGSVYHDLYFGWEYYFYEGKKASTYLEDKK